MTRIQERVFCSRQVKFFSLPPKREKRPAGWGRALALRLPVQYNSHRSSSTGEKESVRRSRCMECQAAAGDALTLVVQRGGFGSESHAPSQGLVVAARATEKEINKYPGKKNIVLVYRTIIYVYDIRAVELIKCPRKRTQPSLPGGGADPGFGTERGCWSQSEGRVAHVRGPRRWGRLSVMTAANRR